MNRILKRPMFRMGGSTGTGITSGLDRPRYKQGSNPFSNTREMGMAMSRSAIPQLLPSGGTTPKPAAGFLNPQGVGLGMGTLPGFLTQFGLNLASATPRGNIFATAAESAKEPFSQFQAAKFAEAQSEKEFERDVELQMLKNLDEDQRTAIRKRAQDGVDAGYYGDINEGIRRLLQTDEFGVADRPGEKRQENIDNLVDIALRQAGMDPVRDEPIVRNQITVVQDYKTLEENNPEIDFAPASLMIIEDRRKDYQPGKVYYSGEENKFFIFNGAEAEQPFTPVDVKR